MLVCFVLARYLFQCMFELDAHSSNTCIHSGGYGISYFKI